MDRAPETSTMAKASGGTGLYFGWRIVLAMFICTFVVFGVSIYSFIIFTKPLAQSFGWSAAQTGSLVSAMWLVAPMALFCAPIIQKFGPWRLIVVGMCVQAAVVASLGLVTEFWQLLLLRIVMGLGKVLVVTSMPVVVSRWFSRRFATAIALAWSGSAAGGILLSPATEMLDAAFGWRSAAVMIAAGMICALIVITLLARGAAAPADLGLGKDGDPRPAVAVDAAGHKEKIAWGELGSIRWATAITMLLAIVGAGAGSLAILTQQPAMFEAVGFSPAAAAAILGLVAAAASIGQASVGWALDRFSAAWVSLGIAALMAAGLLSLGLLPAHPSVALGLVSALGVGMAVGATEVLWIALTKHQFGAGLFAVTYGAWNFALQVGCGLGGGLGGWAYDQRGGAGLLLLVAVLYLPSTLFSIWRPGGRNREPQAELAPAR